MVGGCVQPMSIEANGGVHQTIGFIEESLGASNLFVSNEGSRMMYTYVCTGNQTVHSACARSQV